MEGDLTFKFKSGEKEIKDLEIDCGDEPGEACAYACKVEDGQKWRDATDKEIEEINDDYMLLIDLCEDSENYYDDDDDE